jgi:outer membrane biogenesis lipoprotein LolB
MKTKFIAFTFLTLAAVFFTGCTATTETTTTTRTREESAMYAR